MSYDDWKTTNPDDYLPRCPECDGLLSDDGYDGFECVDCDWCKSGPDPDEAYDRMRDQKLLDIDEDF